MDRAITYFAGRSIGGDKIVWRPSEKRLIWPSGARLQFGHMSTATSHLNYQGSEYHFIGIDEATAIPEGQIMYLHSRLRKGRNDPIPLRFRLATNPGGKSHDFIRDKYVIGADGKRTIYLPALLWENPGLDRDEYLAQLAHLDPITRKQLEEGDWDVMHSGGFFEVEKIRALAEPPWSPEPATRRVRAWDLAATPDYPGTDPDWTVGIKLAMHGGEFHVEDVQRVRAGPAEVERLIARIAESDDCPTLIEQEGGSSGKIARSHYVRGSLMGRDVRFVRASGNKYERAKPLAAAISNELLSWNDRDLNRRDCISELRAFHIDPKEYAHDDVVDALSMAYNELSRPPRPRALVA